MTTDPSREAFEKWARSLPDKPNLTREGTGYRYVYAECYWEAWQAAMAHKGAYCRQPIETAPKDGTHFLALIGGLPYEARFDEQGRFIRFIHTNIAPGAVWKIHHQGGRELREQLLPPEKPQHVPTGMIWQNGFDFKPTHWAPLPAAPLPQGE